MKYLKMLLLMPCLFVLNVHADSLWIEADASGKVGEPQIIKVIFGSYNKYKLQKVEDEFQEVKDFTCWVVSPTGKFIELVFSPKETSFDATFTPTEEGIYAVLLENKHRKVEDWTNTRAKIGIAKQHYYARTMIRVGQNETVYENPLTDLAIIHSPAIQNGRELHLQVLLHGKPVQNATLFMRHPDMQEQQLNTDAEGRVVFYAPKAGRYFSLVTLRFETSGTYNGVPFDVFREKATLITVID